MVTLLGRWADNFYFGEPMTQKALEKLLKYWQKRLKLEHWAIRIKLLNRLDGDREGWCHYQLDYLSAEIHIVDPKAHFGPNKETYNVEHTLLHELMHLHIAPFKTEEGTSLGTHEEQLCTVLARALMEV